jgi:hypothetical protein
METIEDNNNSIAILLLLPDMATINKLIILPYRVHMWVKVKKRIKQKVLILKFCHRGFEGLR